MWTSVLFLYGEAVHPDGGHHSDYESPLWRAVDNACRHSPVSHAGMAARSILQSLVFHGAQADEIGKVEKYSPCDSDSDVSIDSDFSVNSNVSLQTSRSRMTPLGLALAYRTKGAQWSAGIANMLLAAVSEKLSLPDVVDPPGDLAFFAY